MVYGLENKESKSIKQPVIENLVRMYLVRKGEEKV